MLARSTSAKRRGSVIPLVAISLVALIGCVALAVDLGMFAVSRAQAQNMADAAALAGVRSIAWDSAANSGAGGQDCSTVYTAAQNVFTNQNNYILANLAGTTLVEIGFYSYNAKGSTFPVAPFTAPFDDTTTGTNPDPAFQAISAAGAGSVPAKPTSPVDHSTDNWSMVRTTVDYSMKRAFSNIWGLNPFNSRTQASAINRPRDVAVVLDFSGSMRFGSLLGGPYQGQRTQPNNPDPTFPQFGPYATYNGTATTAALQGPLTNWTDGNNLIYEPSNTAVTTTDGRTAIPSQFYATITTTTVNGVTTTTTTPGFPLGYVTADGTTNYAATNPGDKYLLKSAYPVATVQDITGGIGLNAVWESTGYVGKAGAFYGYTQGPGYWGKSFFIWPPNPDGVNPAGTNDWRFKFFTSVTDNTTLWDGSGNWKAPGTYQINYAAIFRWLRNTGPNPFSTTSLRAGRILYYDTMPDPDSGYSGESDANFNTRFRTYANPTGTAAGNLPASPTYPCTFSSGAFSATAPAANSPQRHNEGFWKDYIDYVLGVRQQNDGVYRTSPSGAGGSMVQVSGYGNDFQWPTGGGNPGVRISNKPATQYMDYQDNPLRGRTHFWFGPMTMLDYMGQYNLWYIDEWDYDGQRYCYWPGTISEAPTYQLKLGIRAALTDIKNNHPNDFVALMMFAMPIGTNASTGGSGRFNRPSCPLSQDFTRMTDMLWFPPYTVDNPGTEIRPMDYVRMNATPHGFGGTCYHMGLLLAYNQFSSNTSNELQKYNYNGSGGTAGTDTNILGDAGGNGRKGARKLLIFETDGQPNITISGPAIQTSSQTPVQGSWYNVRWSDALSAKQEKQTVQGDSSMGRNLSVITQMATDYGANQARVPFYVHCLGFGPVLAPGGAQRTNALYALQQMEVTGNVQAGPASSSSPFLADYKQIYDGHIVNGSVMSVQDQIQNAFTKIMQGGVHVALVQ